MKIPVDLGVSIQEIELFTNLPSGINSSHNQSSHINLFKLQKYLSILWDF